jgi:integrase
MKTTKRRDRGSGCVRQRRDRRWEGRLSPGVSSKLTYVYGNTKQDVIEKLRTEQSKPRADNEDKRLTVGEWLDEWLEMVKSTRRFKTYDSYNGAMKNHARPLISSRRLSQLSKKNVYEMFDTLRKGGVGESMLQTVYKVLHCAMEDAVKREMVPNNVVALIKKPTTLRNPRVILRTEEEAQRFRQAVKGSVYEVLYLTALDTGCRQGELFGLKWENVDLVNGQLRVTSTLTQNEAGELVLSPPKTAASIRTVRLAKDSIKMLRKYRKHQMDPKRIHSVWVFPDWDGGPMRRDSYIRRELKRLLKEAKLPPISFHGLRHTHATMLAVRGVPVRATQERLGHSTSRMTVEVYQHATSAMQSLAVTALDAIHESAKRRQLSVSGQLSGQSGKPRNADGAHDAQTLTG